MKNEDKLPPLKKNVFWRHFLRVSLSFREEIKMSTPSELETVTVKCFPGKLQLNEMEMLGGVFAIGEEFTGEENGTQSYLLYEHIGLPKSKMVAFSHTWTPENERGKGIGKAITRGALEWAKVKGYKVLPTCSFVKKFADDNKDEEFVKGVMDLKGRRVVSNNVKM